MKKVNEAGKLVNTDCSSRLLWGFVSLTSPVFAKRTLASKPSIINGHYEALTHPLCRFTGTWWAHRVKEWLNGGAKSARPPCLGSMGHATARPNFFR